MERLIVNHPLSYLILEKDANPHPMELLVLEPTTKFGHHLHLVSPLTGGAIQNM